MKKLLLSISGLLLTSTFINAQAPNFEWAMQTVGTGNEIGKCVKVDGSGNSYITGSFSGTTDFDPGPGTYTMSSTGNSSSNVFILKLDASGNFVWAKKLGRASGGWSDFGNSISLDGLGNVYVTGQFQGTVDFDPGANVFNLTSTVSYNNTFILKLDVNGNFVWAKQIEGYGFGATSNLANAISNDAMGNVYVTGTFDKTCDFDPSINTYTLSKPTGANSDCYFLKLDANGNFVWAKQLNCSYSASGTGIFVDASNSLYFAGSLWGAADFDPGVGSYTLTLNGTVDVFILKLDPSGNFVWAKNMGGTGVDIAYSIAVDAMGNVYTAGVFEGTADFDPSTGTDNLTSFGVDDIFISKLDANGNYSWAKRFGLANTDRAYSVALDGAGNIYATGYYDGNVDFDPSASTYTITPPASNTGGCFILKLNPLGNFVWAGGLPYEGNSIYVDGFDNIYTTGRFYGSNTYDFDPGVGVFNLTPTSGEDLFIQKMSQCFIAPSAPVNSTPSNNQMICANQTTTLSVATNSATVNWYVSPTSTITIANGLSLSTPTLAAGNYTYYAEASTCTVSATRTPITVTVNTLPTINVVSSNTLLCTGQSAVLSASGANTYTWNTSVNTASITVSPTTTTHYTVTGTDANECSNISTITQSVSVCTGINANLSLSNLSIYPNPNNGSFIIQTSSNLNLTIVDELGQVVRIIRASELNNYKVTVEDLNSGIYYIHGTDGHNTINQKVIITK